MKPASLRPFLPFPALRRRRQPLFLRRSYAIQTPGPPTLQVFNSVIKYLQRERAAADPVASRNVDYLRDELAARLCDRLLVMLPPSLAVSVGENFPRVILTALGYRSSFPRCARPGRQCMQHRSCLDPLLPTYNHTHLLLHLGRLIPYSPPP